MLNNVLHTCFIFIVVISLTVNNSKLDSLKFHNTWSFNQYIRHFEVEFSSYRTTQLLVRYLVTFDTPIDKQSINQTINNNWNYIVHWTSDKEENLSVSKSAALAVNSSLQRAFWLVGYSTMRAIRSSYVTRMHDILR